MPTNRRMRLGGLIVFLIVLVVLYSTTAKKATYSSKFYSRTIAAITEHKTAQEKADVIAGEKARQDRVAKVQEEHEVAMDRAAGSNKQVPIVEDIGRVPPAPSAVVEEDGIKGVAGRKIIKEGKIVVDEERKGTDGVAKIGNVQPKEGAKEKTKDNAKEKPSSEERNAEDEINAILKKGPIIVFSKSYCPYSAKAKNILQNLYTITPPPHIVELDKHPMGPAMQAALGKSTGRSTVPNVLVNGKSIGGGDDIQGLHAGDKLIETIQNLGGKRVVEIKKAAGEDAAIKAPRQKPLHLRA